MSEGFERPPLASSAVVLRVTLFVGLAVVGMFLPGMFPVEGALRRSVLATFCAGVLANAIPSRIFEHARFADFGMGWRAGSGRDLLKGLACGAGAAAAVLLAMVAFEWASFEKTPADPAGAVVLTSALFLMGAAGEEMMFHGYAFQLLVRHVGTFATILPVGILFGLVHMGNQSVSLLGVFNTMVFGAVLGYACYRSGALWMPIGMHFGWNAMLPLAGANLSGFTITMRVTGYALHPVAGGVWTGAGYGPEGSVLTTVAAVALFWVVTRWTPGDDEVMAEWKEAE